MGILVLKICLDVHCIDVMRSLAAEFGKGQGHGVFVHRLNGAGYLRELPRHTRVRNSRHAVKIGGGFAKRVIFWCLFCFSRCVARTSSSVSRGAPPELLVGHLNLARK